MALVGLPGVAAYEVPHTMIRNATHLREILRNKEYGTTAGNSGAIDIYRDDAGKIRCSYHRHLKTISNDILENVYSAVIWYNHMMTVIHS